MCCVDVFNNKLLNYQKECRSKSVKKSFLKSQKAIKLKSPARAMLRAISNTEATKI